MFLSTATGNLQYLLWYSTWSQWWFNLIYTCSQNHICVGQKEAFKHLSAWKHWICLTRHWDISSRVSGSKTFLYLKRHQDNLQLKSRRFEMRRWDISRVTSVAIKQLRDVRLHHRLKPNHWCLLTRCQDVFQPCLCATEPGMQTYSCNVNKLKVSTSGVCRNMHCQQFYPGWI